jgi:hypothetical protein
VAASFFAMVIFFVLNAGSFTPLEIVTGVVLVTIAFKGTANIMFAMIIAFIDFDNADEQIEFEKSSAKLESLVNDLALQEASMQTMKTKQEKK